MGKRSTSVACYKDISADIRSEMPMKYCADCMYALSLLYIVLGVSPIFGKGPHMTVVV